MDHTKIYQADLDSPCQELSSGGLVIVVTLLVRWQIIFLSARIGRPIKLYIIGTWLHIKCIPTRSELDHV